VSEGIAQLAEGVNGLRNGFINEPQTAGQSNLGAERSEGAIRLKQVVAPFIPRCHDCL
jgi:hypothetical protein